MNAREALLEFRTALARLEVHRSSLRWRQMAHRIIADEPTTGASYRAAGRRLRRARRRQAPGDGQGAVDLAAAGGEGRPRARRLRGEPAFVFELGGQAFAFVVEGLGTKSIVARQVLEQPGDRPLRRRRLRHGRGDPQRPLLRRRAAAGGQRVLRDRRLGVVPAARARRVAARGLAQGVRGRGLRVGRRRVPVAAGAARRARHRAGGRSRRGRARGTLADPRRAARRRR